MTESLLAATLLVVIAAISIGSARIASCSLDRREHAAIQRANRDASARSWNGIPCPRTLEAKWTFDQA